VNYLGREVTSLAAERGVVFESGTMSTTVDGEHGSMLAFTHAGWDPYRKEAVLGVVLDIRIPTSLLTEAPTRLLAHPDQDAIGSLLTSIGLKLCADPSRGWGRVANSWGGEAGISDEVLRLGRRCVRDVFRWHHSVWDQGWNHQGRVEQFVRSEQRYVWWHREHHVLREYMRTAPMQFSTTPPVLSASSEETAFGASFRRGRPTPSALHDSDL